MCWLHRQRAPGTSTSAFREGLDSFPDPSRVLEGEGKALRHIKFASIAELERNYVRRYIQASIEQLGTGWRPGARNRQERHQEFGQEQFALAQAALQPNAAADKRTTGDLVAGDLISP